MRSKADEMASLLLLLLLYFLLYYIIIIIVLFLSPISAGESVKSISTVYGALMAARQLPTTDRRRCRGPASAVRLVNRSTTTPSLPSSSRLTTDDRDKPPCFHPSAVPLCPPCTGLVRSLSCTAVRLNPNWQSVMAACNSLLAAGRTWP